MRLPLLLQRYFTAIVGHPIARGAGGGIPGNDLGQGSTSTSTFAHVLGVSGAPIGAVGGAADGRRNMTQALTPRQQAMVPWNDAPC